MEEEDQFECSNCGQEFIIKHKGEARIEICPFCSDGLFDVDEDEEDLNWFNDDE